jgi:undecaprenyl-diphosphatase
MFDKVQGLDESILFFIQEHMKNPALDRVMVFITSLGDAGFLWIATAFVLMLIKRYQACGVTLLCSLSFSTFLGDNLLKPLFHRVRPCNKFPEIVTLIRGLHSPSFPSGHTMAAFASATILYYYDRRIGIPAYVIASLIAFSRLYLFVHYPSDILGGMLLGIITSLIMLYGLNKIYKSLESNVSST